MSKTGTAKLLAELGELGRVIGLLYQKVEASEQSASAENQRVQEKLDTWIQTNGSILSSNQELLKLIVLNSQELQRSTNSYEKGASLWTSLQQQLTVFEQRMTDWNNSSGPAAANPETSEQLSQLNQSCQALNQRLDQLSQSGTKPDKSQGTSGPRQSETVASFSWDQISINLPWLAGSGAALIVLGGLALLGLQGLNPEYRVKTPATLTVEDAALLDWAISQQGQQARELMRWNSGLLDDRSCEQEVERLGVTLALQGKSARSGFCTLWVVPPEDRKFEPG